MSLVVLRLFLILAGLVIAAAVLVGLMRRDRRWFRFAWQLIKFSAMVLLVILAALAVGRIVLR